MANPILLLLLLPILTVQSTPTIQWWCRHTPHPTSCLTSLSHSHSNSPPLPTRSSFYKLALQSALQLATLAESRLKKLGDKCEIPAQKTAWLDCRTLFASTALQLTRTLSRSTPPDAQTWLSAALTNLNTCNKGFAELKANASFMRPVLRYNLPDLISNCLAVNYNASFGGVGPSWVVEDVAGGGGADFVVAGDGSGDFGTVGEAVEAAGEMRRRMRGKRRIVIHVVAGVYAEYLVVGSGVYDLTIKGDGKGRTVITGGRSVALGYTTFNCPTVSKNLIYFFELDLGCA